MATSAHHLSLRVPGVGYRSRAERARALQAGSLAGGGRGQSTNPQSTSVSQQVRLVASPKPFPWSYHSRIEFTEIVNTPIIW